MGRRKIFPVLHDLPKSNNTKQQDVDVSSTTKNNNEKVRGMAMSQQNCDQENTSNAADRLSSSSHSNHRRAPAQPQTKVIRSMSDKSLISLPTMEIALLAEKSDPVSTRMTSNSNTSIRENINPLSKNNCVSTASNNNNKKNQYSRLYNKPMALPEIPPFRPQNKPASSSSQTCNQHKHRRRKTDSFSRGLFDHATTTTTYTTANTLTKSSTTKISFSRSPKSSANDIVDQIKSISLNNTTHATTTTVEKKAIQIVKSPMLSILKNGTNHNNYNNTHKSLPLRCRQPSDLSSETSTTATSSFDNIHHAVNNATANPSSPNNATATTMNTSTSSTCTISSSCNNLKQIRFDPKIWVHEICPPPSHIWFTKEELQRFKEDAITRIRRWYCHLNQRQQHIEGEATSPTTARPLAASPLKACNSGSGTNVILPSGTGRIIHVGGNKGGGKKHSGSSSGGGSSSSTKSLRNFPSTALFSDPALSAEWEFDDGGATTLFPNSSTSRRPSTSSLLSSTSSSSIPPQLLPLSISIAKYEKKEQTILDTIQKELKSILLVDPHDIFLKLLTKGILVMLPHVKITFARSAAEARMKIANPENKATDHATCTSATSDDDTITKEEGVSSTSDSKTIDNDNDYQCTHGFDVIIIEERLGLLNRRSSLSKQQTNKLDQSSNNNTGFFGNVKHQEPNNNNDNHDRCSINNMGHSADMSGANLIRWINTDIREKHENYLLQEHKLVDHHHPEGCEESRKVDNSCPSSSPSPSICATDSNSKSSFKKRYPLLIGMSAYLKQDEEKLRDCGSDYIWGKPPPPMGRDLRNEILRLIMLKRNYHDDLF